MPTLEIYEAIDKVQKPVIAHGPLALSAIATLIVSGPVVNGTRRHPRHRPARPVIAFDLLIQPAFIGVLSKHDIKISMDGKGARQRLRRPPVAQREVYLHAYDSVSAAREGIGRYLDLCNRRRPHSSLDGRTPDAAYFEHESKPLIRLAA